MPSLIDHFVFNDATLAPLPHSAIDAAVALINRAYSYQDTAKGEPRITAAKLRDRLNSSDFYGVFSGPALIGCVYLEPQGHTLHFGLLTVTEKFRGTGLAPALLRAIEQYARAHHYTHIQLDYMSLAPWLKPYYERYGYTETGTITPWGTIDLIRMAKTLHP